MNQTAMADVHADVRVNVAADGSEAARVRVTIVRNAAGPDQSRWMTEEPQIEVALREARPARVSAIRCDSGTIRSVSGPAGLQWVDLGPLTVGERHEVEFDLDLPPRPGAGRPIDIGRLDVEHRVDDPSPGCASSLTATFPLQARWRHGVLQVGVAEPVYELFGALPATEEHGYGDWQAAVELRNEETASDCRHSPCFGFQAVDDEGLARALDAPAT